MTLPNPNSIRPGRLTEAHKELIRLLAHCAFEEVLREVESAVNTGADPRRGLAAPTNAVDGGPTLWTLKPTPPVPAGQSKPTDDVILGRMRPLPPLVPDGIYTGVFKRPEKGQVQGRDRQYLWFAISDPGPYLGLEVYHPCPTPKAGRKQFGLGSNLIVAYQVATGGFLPKRMDQVSTKVFRGKLFRFQTRTVKEDQDGNTRPAVDHYSIIQELVSVEVGAKK